MYLVSIQQKGQNGVPPTSITQYIVSKADLPKLLASEIITNDLVAIVTFVEKY